HRLRDPGVAAGGRDARPMTLSAPLTRARTVPADDGLVAAIDRVTGTRPIGGNLLQHHPDSPRALDAMLELIAHAERWIHFENYIIRDDATGRRFADALAERARAGVRVRVAYDALGSFGTSRRFWRALRAAGVEVRVFHPLLSPHLLDAIARDHRKLLVVDGAPALLDAARSGVDVRLLVPGTSDLPVMRNFTRGGYRDLLRAGARIFEWQGPMLHAKTLLVDQRWARVGSSNLNVSSLLGNYELDL